MANPFLVGSSHEELETAIIYDNALVYDIGNAVAYTDGNRIVVNTDDNLTKILPDYNQDFLKWILWHERYHMDLKHHKRYFKYLKEMDESDKFHITKDEVNIIMDILVHDSLSKMFPELVETAMKNLAQMRNRNSLNYTFKTNTLEDMLDEYSKHKREDDLSDDGSSSKKDDGKPSKDSGKSEKKKSKKDGGKEKDSTTKGHGEGGTGDDKTHKKDSKPEVKDDAEKPESEHDKTDWSKLDKIDSTEFVGETQIDRYQNEINRLRRKKLKIGRLTQKLNGLASTKRDRTYRLPSMLQTSDGCIFKGKTPGRVELYLVFDASGSMSGDMQIFKDIITKSIPQALRCPCEWFAGRDYDHKCTITPYKTEHGDGYYKGTFKDFLPINACSGFDDDGDRTIELCWQAEQKGFSPIGVTDGGGTLGWSKNKLKELKRTVLVGQNKHWLDKVKQINPKVQTLDIDMRGGE